MSRARLSGRRSLVALAACAAQIAQVQANSFGNYFSTGPIATGNFIRQANTTLILPDTPNPLENNISLWAGMGMSDGDLVQALAVSYPGTNDGANCGQLGENWCVLASVLKSGADSQTEGPASVAAPAQQVTMSYLYNDNTDAYDQFVYVDGDLVSTLSSSTGGKSSGWGTAEECQPGTPCGTMPGHRWINTALVLDAAEPGWGSTVGIQGSTGALVSSDGGTTWTADSITIDPYTYTTGQ